jgi:hypothetical protein
VALNIQNFISPSWRSTGGEGTNNTEKESSDNNENKSDKITLRLSGSESLIAPAIVEKNYSKFIKFKLML